MLKNKPWEPLVAILNSVVDGVFTVDDELRITSYNRAAEEITGFTREEVIGQYCYDIFRTDVCTSSCPLLEAWETGRPVVNRDVEIVAKDNRWIPISVSASVLRDENGKSIGGVETFRDQSQVHVFKREIKDQYTFYDLVSRNAAMRRLFDVLPDIAVTDATVLLYGESGTGKGLFARALHELSVRKDGALVTIDCGALPEPLLESEIFGARLGACTGTVENRSGRLAAAEGGSLFLDEIGDLPLSLQTKLLRVLESREFQPLGVRQPQRVDVRFITATHCDLDQMVQDGQFRRDLFFRINVVALRIPPLRERREDIPLLIDIFLNRFNRTYTKRIRGYSAEAMQLLLQYDYPGNVRELLNMVEQTVILCREGEIGIEHLPPNFITTVPVFRSYGARAKKKNLSRDSLSDILASCDGNRSRVARELGIDRTTLWRWMKRHDLIYGDP